MITARDVTPTTRFTRVELREMIRAELASGRALSEITPSLERALAATSTNFEDLYAAVADVVAAVRRPATR